jgi:hypothetical protein
MPYVAMGGKHGDEGVLELLGLKNPAPSKTRGQIIDSGAVKRVWMTREREQPANTLLSSFG